MQQRTLVLCDIDKTLITVEGSPVPCGLRTVTDALQHGGMTFGLCSDSSVPTMKHWADHFGFSGPMIAERGAILLAHPDAGPQFLGKWPDYFRDLRERFFSALSVAGQFRAMRGDPAEIFRLLREGAGFDGAVAVLNDIRLASLSAYARRVEARGGAEIDFILLGQLERTLRGCVDAKPPDFPYYWDRNPEYGILIMGAKEAMKSLGVSRLLGETPYDRVILIGDSIWDFVDDSRVEQWAVANATLEYRSRCSMVSAQDFTLGVEELLRTLL